MSWLNKIKYSVIIMSCSILSSCCIGYDDYHKLLTAEQAAWIPDPSLKSFIMENEYGIKESFVLDSFEDTIITMNNDKCNCQVVFQRRSAAYISTFTTEHHFEQSLNTLNFTDLDIGINWEQQASWDFDKNKQIPHSYTSNNYPNPKSISIVSDTTINNQSYPKVMTLKFAPADVEETGVIEAYFIPLQGIVYYKLKNGVSFYRNPMP